MQPAAGHSFFPYWFFELEEMNATEGVASYNEHFVA